MLRSLARDARQQQRELLTAVARGQVDLPDVRANDGADVRQRAVARLAGFVLEELAGVHAFAGAARKYKTRHPGVDHLQTALEIVDLKFKNVDEIGFVQNDRVCAGKHTWIFIGLVVSFWYTRDDHRQIRPQLEIGRTDQITDILNKEQP